MTDVHVAVKNNSGNTVTLLLDDERDAERIEYLQKLVRREDLDSVNVGNAPSKAAPKSSARKS